MTAPSPTSNDDVGPSILGRLASALGLESIKSRIIVLALLATVIPYAGMAWFTYAQNKSAITIEIEEQLRTLSSQAAREADIWMRTAHLRFGSVRQLVRYHRKREGRHQPRRSR